MLGTASRPVGQLCNLQPCRRIHQSIVSGVDSAIPIRLSIERAHQSLEYGISQSDTREFVLMKHSQVGTISVAAPWCYS